MDAFQREKRGGSSTYMEADIRVSALALDRGERGLIPFGMRAGCGVMLLCII